MVLGRAHAPQHLETKPVFTRRGQPHPWQGPVLATTTDETGARSTRE